VAVIAGGVVIAVMKIWRKFEVNCKHAAYAAQPTFGGNSAALRRGHLFRVLDVRDVAAVLTRSADGSGSRRDCAIALRVMW